MRTSAFIIGQYSLAGLFLAGMAMLCVYSLYFGVNPYDETFYIAMPYHLVLGGSLFFDEYSLAQTAALFSYPFFKMFYILKNNTDGIVLFSRYLYTVISLIFAGAIFYLLRNTIKKPALIIIVSVCLAWVPFNIHGLSYNTLGMIFLTLCLFLNFYMAEHISKIIVFLSALFLTCTVIAYPTFVLLIPVVMFSVWWFIFRRADSKYLKLYFFSLCLMSLGFLCLLVMAGINIDQIKKVLSFQLSIGAQGGGFAKLNQVIHQIWISLPHKYGLIFCMLLLILEHRLNSVQLKILARLLLVFVLAFILQTLDATGNMHFLAIPALLLHPLLKQNSWSRNLFYLVWLPSCCAGLIASWTSSNGIINTFIGIFPAAIVSLCFIAAIFSEAENYLKSSISILGLILLIYIIYPTQITHIRYFYGDFSREQLTEKIPSGIFSGIYTTEAKKQYYLQLANDLHKFSQGRSRVLFFDDFPAGYLMTNLKPNTNTVWLFSGVAYPKLNRQATIDYFQNRDKPDFIVQITQVAENPNPKFYKYEYPKNDAIAQYLKNYQLSLDQENYKFYLSKPALLNNS